jgi:hypothetical protein
MAQTAAGQKERNPKRDGVPRWRGAHHPFSGGKRTTICPRATGLAPEGANFAANRKVMHTNNLQKWAGIFEPWEMPSLFGREAYDYLTAFNGVGARGYQLYDPEQGECKLTNAGSGLANLLCGYSHPFSGGKRTTIYPRAMGLANLQCGCRHPFSGGKRTTIYPPATGLAPRGANSMILSKGKTSRQAPKVD